MTDQDLFLLVLNPNVTSSSFLYRNNLLRPGGTRSFRFCELRVTEISSQREEFRSIHERVESRKRVLILKIRLGWIFQVE